MAPSSVYRARWRTMCVALTLGIAGSATSIGFGNSLAAEPKRVANETLEWRADLAKQSIEAEVRRYSDALTTVAAGLGSQHEIEASEFATATSPLKQMNLAGATSIAFVASSRHGDVAALQQYWRERGAADLTLRPTGTGDHLFSIMSTRLDGAPPRPLGNDISQTTAPAAALYEARRTNGVIVSDTYQFLRDQELPESQRQSSFVLAAPISKAAGNGSQFQGWVVMGLRGQDFFGSVLRYAGDKLVDLALSAENTENVAVRVATLRSDAAGDRDLHRSRSITVAQQHWTLNADAVQAALPGGWSVLPAVVSAGGTVLSVLTAALLYILITSRARALARVDAATAELRISEAEARRQAALMSAIMESISDGVGVVDSSGDFILHNASAKDMLGVGDTADASQWQEHYGIFCRDGVTPFPMEDLPLVRALSGEATNEVEMVIRNASQPDGITISVSGRPLEFEEEQGAVAVFRDVTESKRQEEELKAFAGVVAHDLKSPLAIVSGYTEILEDEIAAAVDSDSLARFQYTISKVNVGIERMQCLIDDLLSYTAARDSQLDESEVDLECLIREVAVERAEAFVKGSEPMIQVAQLPLVRGDAILLRQVVNNLIGNAIKYTDEGRRASIDISATVESGWVRIEVADRGIGIPMGQHAAIFAGFHRAHADKAYPGTGLGLSICQRIVERHGGSMGVTDNPGGGSRFFFTVPAARPQHGGSRFGEVLEAEPTSVSS